MMSFEYKLSRQFKVVSGGLLVASFCLGSLRAEDRAAEASQTKTISEGVKEAHSIVEGALIKVKAKKNEIYLRSVDGKRLEIYLDEGVQIVHGSKTLKLEDLKKDMRLRVTGRNKVEVLN